jgi:hypothetical protein
MKWTKAAMLVTALLLTAMGTIGAQKETNTRSHNELEGVLSEGKPGNNLRHVHEAETGHAKQRNTRRGDPTYQGHRQRGPKKNPASESPSKGSSGRSGSVNTKSSKSKSKKSKSSSKSSFMTPESVCPGESLVYCDATQTKMYLCHHSAAPVEYESLCISPKEADSYLSSNNVDYCGTCKQDACAEANRPANFNCTDDDLCTIEEPLCDENTNFTWVCSASVPVVCKPKESCYPVDGSCKPDDDLVPCVAIIDEDDDFGSPNQTATWVDFRNKYPFRPFCLIHDARLTVPAVFEQDPLATHYTPIMRDNGNPVGADDWVTLCGLGKYNGTSTVKWVGLFIDDSGSLEEEEVSAARDLFNTKLQALGIEVKVVVNPNENWIAPFMTELAPKPTRRI